MKNRKLKRYVIPTIYVMTLSVIFITLVFLGNALTPAPSEDTNLDYSVDSIIDTELPVMEEVKLPVKPFTSETVSISKDFYSMTDEQLSQENALIYYQNTYLQNTGVLYTDTQSFEVNTVLDGTVKNITEDELLGIVVEISHEKSLTSFYYSLSEVNVKVGDTVKISDKIGLSGDNKIENKEGSSLMFEVYYQGKTLDPITFYETELINYE